MVWRRLGGILIALGCLGIGGCGVTNFNLTLSPEEIDKVAREITVIVDGCGAGSGVLYKREGDTYSILTANHVINEKLTCSIMTPDGKKYAAAKEITRPVPEVDLAILQFKSKENYKLGEIEDQNQLKESDRLYIAGAPGVSEINPKRTVQVTSGGLLANITKALTKADKNGYNILYLYDNYTLPGMSGGSILNNHGKLVGIHALGVVNFQSIAGLSGGIPIHFLDPSKYAAYKNQPEDEALKLLSDASTLWGQGNIKIASEKYDAAVQIQPNRALSHFIRGVFYFVQGKEDKAIADLSQAIKLNPNFSMAQSMRGNVYLSRKKYDKAMADYNETIKLNPTYQAAYVSRGGIYMTQGKYDKAIDDYNQAIKLNPNDSSAYKDRGDIYYIKKEYDKAINDFNQVIKMNQPLQLADAYNSRGHVYDDRGDKDKALADYNQAITLSLNLVPTVLLFGNSPKVINEFNMNIAELYNSRGKIYIGKGEQNRAIADYDKAIQLDPRNADTYYNRGNAYYNKGEKDRAIADYDKAIQLDPKFANAYYNRGIIYSENGETEKALAEYSQTIKFNSKAATAYYNRGAIYFNKGEQDKALVDFKKAAEIFRQQGDTNKESIVLDVIKSIEGN